MILGQLTLRNFCLFQGVQSFDLRPGNRGGRHVPIVLFGGINGGGKTTLLDAIQLVLYGARARCSKRANLSYEDFLRHSIHHGPTASETAAGITLSFRNSADGQERLYEVARSWRVVDDRLREELRVSEDGVPSLWLADNWAQLIEDLLPLDISQLFFFDAEKIRTLAEDEGSSKALGAAITSLLGLDIVERLITDSTVLQGRLAKKLGTPEHQSQVAELEQAVREEQVRQGALTTERAALENHRLRAVEDQKAAQVTFAAAGGLHYEARAKRGERLAEVAAQEEALRGQLVTIASGELPLALAGDLLAQVDVQDRGERRAADAEVIQRLLAERDERLLATLREARASAALLKRIADFLAGDRRSRDPAAPSARRLALSEPARARLHDLREQKPADRQAEASRLLAKLDRTTHEREELERAIAAAPDDADIGKLVEALAAATQRLAHLEAEAGRLDEARAAQQQKTRESEARLRKLLESAIDAKFAREDAVRMSDLAGRTRQTMEVFLGRVTARKIDRLSEFVTESFRYLLRKQTLVERIHIDPATFAIALENGTGQAISKQRLSEGEKQIFAISVLWGLARASARPLPAVIDTPMARLDAAHRTHLVERYFPSASHQVVIFSTDTDVDQHYFRALQPFIARAYHLNYDEELRRTVGEEGYFWS